MVAHIKEPLSWMLLGAGGQLGSAFTNKIKDNGFEFIAFTHSQLDITDSDEVARAINTYKPNFVINNAAWTKVDDAEIHQTEAFTLNTLAPAVIAKECSKYSAKFVHFSTDYVFSGDANEPWSEDSQTSALSVYGKTKAAGEELILGTYPTGSYIVRTSWLYSKWGQNFVKTILRLALRDENPIQVVQDQYGQPTSAIHLVDQVVLMLENNAPPGIYHGSNSGGTSWFKFAQEIFMLAGADPTRVISKNSTTDVGMAQRPKYSILGHDRWSEVGINPMCDWKQALRECFPDILYEMKLKG
jgi:dTDP-4-dehydrorhamnose reductase